MRGRPLTMAFGIRYTSMLGRRRSLKPLLRQLRNDGVRNVRTSFIQGRTRRWALRGRSQPMGSKS